MELLLHAYQSAFFHLQWFIKDISVGTGTITPVSTNYYGIKPIQYSNNLIQYNNTK